MGAFREHLRAAHDFFLCDVCLEHKKCFLGEQMLYSRGDLARHRDKGDPSHGCVRDACFAASRPCLSVYVCRPVLNHAGQPASHPPFPPCHHAATRASFFGHPACNFCNQRFYDTGHLYQHFVKAHYACDICERHFNIQHKCVSSCQCPFFRSSPTRPDQTRPY